MRSIFMKNSINKPPADLLALSSLEKHYIIKYTSNQTKTKPATIQTKTKQNIPTFNKTEQSWWHRGAQLETGSLLDKRYVRYDNSLVISAFKAHEFERDIHSTTYKCQASNSLGTIISRDVVINAGK